jgi:hypothetical protein
VAGDVEFLGVLLDSCRNPEAISSFSFLHGAKMIAQDRENIASVQHPEGVGIFP